MTCPVLNLTWKKNFHLSLVIFYVAAVVPVLSGTVTDAKRNILLIIVDDLRPSLGCYGDPLAHTPNIDSLALDSYVFTRAYTQQALCGPSRTSLLTSRSPHHLRQYDVHQYWRESAGNFTSLPQFFKENGYRSMSVGKIFHPGKCANFTDDQPYSWSEQPFHPDSQKHKNDDVCPDIDGSGPSKSIVCPVNVQEQPGHTLPDLQSLHAAKSYLLSHVQKNSQTPFFLAVGFHKPHIPLKFPRKYLRYHPLENVSLPSMRWHPPNLPNPAWNPWNDLRKRDDIKHLNITFPWESMPDYWAAKVKQSYYSSVSYIDDLIGELLLQLVNLGQRSNTIILLTSDHGFSLGEHGEWSKYSNYEVSTKVPLLISIPNREGRNIGELVELLDIFPTLADFSGIGKGVPKCLNGNAQKICTDGRSLKPLINRRAQTSITGWREGAFSQYPRPGDFPSCYPDSDQPRLQNTRVMGYSIRTSQYRYSEWVLFDPGTLQPNWTHIFGSELYDHFIDPDENLNLSDRVCLQHVIVALKKSLHKRWSE